MFTLGWWDGSVHHGSFTSHLRLTYVSLVFFSPLSGAVREREGVDDLALGSIIEFAEIYLVSIL